MAGYAHRAAHGADPVGSKAPYERFPQVISGLRKPIAIQAAISFNMNLPE